MHLRSLLHSFSFVAPITTLVDPVQLYWQQADFSPLPPPPSPPPPSPPPPPPPPLPPPAPPPLTLESQSLSTGVLSAVIVVPIIAVVLLATGTVIALYALRQVSDNCLWVGMSASTAWHAMLAVKTEERAGMATCAPTHHHLPDAAVLPCSGASTAACWVVSWLLASPPPPHS
jgi:hypothetical protein